MKTNRTIKLIKRKLEIAYDKKEKFIKAGNKSAVNRYQTKIETYLDILESSEN